VGKANEIHYDSVDGAMYLTSEESWKESKLGGIHQPKDIVQVSPKRSELTASTYITHLGDMDLEMDRTILSRKHPNYRLLSL